MTDFGPDVKVTVSGPQIKELVIRRQGRSVVQTSKGTKCMVGDVNLHMGKKKGGITGEFPSVRLVVSADAMNFFTTLLQWGIELEAEAETPLIDFLQTCPGITKAYLAENVQTIFLDGTAVDDLKIPLAGEYPVVALSAAMPGLAGAIFRRDSIHSSLRTATSHPATSQAHSGQMLTVRLKLFNQIAKEKGAAFLIQGVVMASSSVANFLNSRKELISTIQRAELNGKCADMEALISEICHFSTVRLSVQSCEAVKTESSC